VPCPLTVEVDYPSISHMQHSLFASAENVVPFAERGSSAPSETRPGPGPYENYTLGGAYDEMFTPQWGVRPHYSELHRRVATLSAEELRRRQQACEQSFLHQGITFTVLRQQPVDRANHPEPIFCRASSRRRNGPLLETGLKQRIQALNMFLHDVLLRGRVLKDGLVPRSRSTDRNITAARCGSSGAARAYVNVCGTDLVRREDGKFVVLEDNLRVPSGVSYMLANRDVVRRAFPAIFRSAAVRAHRTLPSGSAFPR